MEDRVGRMCVHGGGGGEKSALNQLSQTKRIIGGVVLSERYRSGEEGWDSDGACLICTGVLPSSCSQLTADIFIRLAHTVQRRNKLICKSTLLAKDKISTGWNIAVFHKRNHSFLFMHLSRHCHAKVPHKTPPPLCPMKQKTEKLSKFVPWTLLVVLKVWMFFFYVFLFFVFLFLSAFSSRPSVGFSQKPAGLIPVSLHKESLLSSYTLV